MVAYFSIGISRVVVLNVRSLHARRTLLPEVTCMRGRTRRTRRTRQGGESFNEMVFGFRMLLEASVKTRRACTTSLFISKSG